MVTTTAIMTCKAPVTLSPPGTNKRTPSYFLQARCPSCHPTNSVKALKGKIHTSLVLLNLCSTLWARKTNDNVAYYKYTINARGQNDQMLRTHDQTCSKISRWSRCADIRTSCWSSVASCLLLCRCKRSCTYWRVHTRLWHIT